MSNVKERIIGAITVMSEENAEKLWILIETKFSSNQWAGIEEIEPDETDIQMAEEAKHNPECQVFLSQEEAYKELNL